MRLFVAITLSEAVRRVLADAQVPLRAAAPGERWVSPDKLHVTVRFLGEVDATAVPPLVAALEAAARQSDPIPVEVRGIGAFPTWRRARVVWAGVTPDPKLELLHHDVETGFTALGYEVEGRPFRPHVTLARLRAPGGTTARAIAEAARGVKVRAPMIVEGLDLMQSHRGAGGTRYESLATIALGRRR